MGNMRFFVLALLCFSVGCGSNGTGEDCTPNDRTICKDGTVYWVDSCGNQGDRAGDCECGCNAEFTACKEPCDCTPSCEGKECGPDGCGGTCAPGCSGDETCNEATGQCEGGCVPDCAGKCCGDDGCGSTCPDNCADTGQSCNEQSCECEGSCEPDCEGKVCGPDGCGDQCSPGCGEGETCDDGGQCIPSDCGVEAQSITGVLATGVADVGFQTAITEIRHKRDIDEFEDGCIYQIDIILQYGDGCEMTVTAGGKQNANNALAVQSLSFIANSQCPNFPDDREGAYVDTGGMSAWVVPSVTEIQGVNAAQSCVDMQITLELEGTLRRESDGIDLTVDASSIALEGVFLSGGDENATCPCETACEGKECGLDGCGGICPPGCEAGERCNNGVCEAVPVDMTWIEVFGGQFMMGSEMGQDDEMPVHRVAIRDFEMTETEVTVVQYTACVDDGACTAPETGFHCNWEVAGRGGHPVNCVDWQQSVDFCTWAGGRLPTEAEWEYAARSGGQDITYPWGDETATCDYAVMADGCGEGRTWPVCSKPAGNTDQGLCDMAGNVYEWVQDWYHDTYDGAPSDGGAWESPAGTYRIPRGGSWCRYADNLRASDRNWSNPDNWSDHYGFRCAR